MPDLDLDAIRERAEKATPGPWDVDDEETSYVLDVDGGRWVACTPVPADALYIAEASPDVILTVLALVDELRKALTRLRDYGALTDEFVRMTAEAALAGSPAEEEEPS